MVKLTKNDKISIYGNLNINSINNKSQKNICMAFENKKISIIGDYIYNFLQEEYKKINYDWMNNKTKTKTMKVVINGENLKSNSSVSITGYVEDHTGISEEYGKIKINNIYLEDLFKEIETLYDDYICEFNTIRSGLKFRIEEIIFE